MNRMFVSAIVALGAILLLGAFNSFFIVRQTQTALVLWFGEARRVIQEPGLHLKVPVAETVILLDKQVLPVDIPQQQIFAADRKQLVVDAFARYRIADPVRYFRAYGTETTARARLEGYLSSAVRNVVASQNFAAVLTEKRALLMLQIRDSVNAQVKSDGVQIVDVRIRRADLPEQNSKSIYQRMRTERQQEAAAIRAEGSQRALEITSRAQRDATVLIAEAQRDADIARGQGDAERNRVFAEAYSQDPEFFAFYRSMKAYDEALTKDHTTVVIGTGSDFFRYLDSPAGTKP